MMSHSQNRTRHRLSATKPKLPILPSAVSQCKLERDAGTVVEVDGVDVGISGSQVPGRDVKDPNAEEWIKPECFVRIVSLDRLLHDCRCTSRFDPCEKEARDDAGRSDRNAMRVVNG